MKLKERAKQLKTDVPTVFLALKRKETPWYAKILAAIIVIYALSPIDLIPDFIPVWGLIDKIHNVQPHHGEQMCQQKARFHIGVIA